MTLLCKTTIRVMIVSIKLPYCHSQGTRYFRVMKGCWYQQSPNNEGLQEPKACHRVTHIALRSSNPIFSGYRRVQHPDILAYCGFACKLWSAASILELRSWALLRHAACSAARHILFFARARIQGISLNRASSQKMLLGLQPWLEPKFWQLAVSLPSCTLHTQKT